MIFQTRSQCLSILCHGLWASGDARCEVEILVPKVISFLAAFQFDVVGVPWVLGRIGITFLTQGSDAAETVNCYAGELVIASPLRSALARRGASDLIHLGAARLMGQTPSISILAILDNFWTKEG